jgi:hypothetical protein
VTYPPYNPTPARLRLPNGTVVAVTVDAELPDGRFAVTVGQPPSKLAKPASRRARKPSVRSLVKQAERSGKKVMSVTVDGTTLHFGPQPDIESNPWRDDLRKGTMP